MRAMMRIVLVLLLLCPACSAETKGRNRRVRPSALAGAWYPANRAELALQVEGFLARAGTARMKVRPVALIAPHAGYVYSGAVAAHAFRLVRGRTYERVIVLAPSHHKGFRGFSIMDVAAYRTPLGEIPLDGPVCRAMRKHPLHVADDSMHVPEHAIEIELPFLQVTVKGVKLVPILVGSLGPGDAAKISEALSAYASPETLIVVSSDFTHYGRRFGYVPFRENVPERLRELDMGAVDLILKKDCEGYARYLKKTGATICGRNAIAILLRMLPKEAEGKLLKYDTSGRITGDFANSVSYVSAVFFVPTGHGERAMSSLQDSLATEEKRTLLRLARETIEQYLKTGKLPELGEGREGLTPSLKAKAGAFVTLKERGRLRGCIGRSGYPELADELPPVYQAVRLMAVQSATRDQRFPAVRPAEMGAVEIEISALTIAREVGCPEDFPVGGHGIIIRKGSRSAVFLPQVAPAQGWDRDETLNHLCRKA